MNQGGAGREIETMAEDENKAKEEQIVEWLRLVDKPVGTKKESKKDTGSGDK